MSGMGTVYDPSAGQNVPGHLKSCGACRVRFTIGFLSPPRSGAGDEAPACSSVAQRQSIRLLTGGLLVRIQPEEPLTPASLAFAALGLASGIRAPGCAGRDSARIQPEEPLKSTTCIAGRLLDAGTVPKSVPRGRPAVGFRMRSPRFRGHLPKPGSDVPDGKPPGQLLRQRRDGELLLRSQPTEVGAAAHPHQAQGPTSPSFARP